MRVVLLAWLNPQRHRIDQSEGHVNVRAQRRVDVVRIEYGNVRLPVHGPIGVVADDSHV